MTTPLRTTQQHKRKGGLSDSAWAPSWQAQAPLLPPASTATGSPLLLLEDPFNDSDCDMQTTPSFHTTRNAGHDYLPIPSSSSSACSFPSLRQQLREPGLEVLGHKHATSSDKQSTTTRCERGEAEASNDIFSLMESKVRQLERVVAEFNQALDITALQPYFGDVGAQLQLISLDTSKRLAEFSTFYHWLRQHNTPLGVTPAGYFSILPEELSMYILSFLDVHELARVERVSRYWRRLVEDDQVWHRLHRARWGSGAHSQLVRQMSFERSGSASDSGDEEGQPEEAVKSMSTSSAMTTTRRAKRKRRGWRDVYIEADRLEKNWRAGKYSTKPVQRSTVKQGMPLPQEIAYCIKFDEHRMVTGSNDRCVRLSDIRSGQLLHTLAGHSAEVRSVDFDSAKIASGSRDRSVKVWDINTGQCLITMNEHAGPVKCMQMTDNLIMSGSEDATIKVLDLNSGQVVNTFRGHVWGVACLQFRDNFVVSGSRDRRVFLWDKRITTTTADSGVHASSPGRHQKTSLLRVMEGHSNTVRCVAFNEENIVSGSWDNTIKVWSVATGQLRNTLEGHDGRVLHLDFDRHKIVSGSVDKTVRVWWDYDSPTRSSSAYSLALHQAPIFHLRFDDYGITSASRDTELIRWDFYSPCADDVRKTRRSLRVAAAGGGLA